MANPSGLVLRRKYPYIVASKKSKLICATGISRQLKKAGFEKPTRGNIKIFACFSPENDFLNTLLTEPLTT